MAKLQLPITLIGHLGYLFSSYAMVELLERMGPSGGVMLDRIYSPTRFLSLRHSLLIYLYNHSIVPVSSGHNIVRVPNYYFLDKMEFG